MSQIQIKWPWDRVAWPLIEQRVRAASESRPLSLWDKFCVVMNYKQDGEDVERSREWSGLEYRRDYMGQRSWVWELNKIWKKVKGPNETMLEMIKHGREQGWEWDKLEYELVKSRVLRAYIAPSTGSPMEHQRWLAIMRFHNDRHSHSLWKELERRRNIDDPVEGVHARGSYKEDLENIFTLIEWAKVHPLIKPNVEGSTGELKLRDALLMIARAYDAEEEEKKKNAQSSLGSHLLHGGLFTSRQMARYQF